MTEHNASKLNSQLARMSVFRIPHSEFPIGFALNGRSEFGMGMICTIACCMFQSPPSAFQPSVTSRNSAAFQPVTISAPLVRAVQSEFQDVFKNQWLIKNRMASCYMGVAPRTMLHSNCLCKIVMKYQIQKCKQFDSAVLADEIGLSSAFQRFHRLRMTDKLSPEIDVVSISQLVDAAKAGDSAAHSEICRQVQGQLNQMADKHLDAGLRRKLNPSDIVQATLTRMVQGFGDFRGSSSAEFYGWLNRILKNEVHSTRRDLQRQRRDVRRENEQASAVIRGQSRPEDEMPSQRLQTQEKMAQFHKVIDRLRPDQAEVIKLRSLQELPFSEVARQMDRSENAVSKLWSRALISLQQELAKLDDSFSS